MPIVKGKRWSDFWQKYVSARVPLGLSAVHISRSPALEIASGGDLVRLNGFKWSGFSVGNEQTKRGIVKDFSRESRRRFLRLIASIDKKKAGEPIFITLDYPCEYSPHWHVWKRDLDTFIKALRAKYPRAWGVWRLEFQKRGAPHFHILLWDGPVIEDVLHLYSVKKKRWIWVGDTKNSNNRELFNWISSTWFRVVGSGDAKHLRAGTRTEPIQSWNGVVYYISKYLAKLTEDGFVPEGFAGRFWGVINKDAFPIEYYKWNISEGEFYKLRRMMRKRLEKKFKKKIECHGDDGLTMYMENEECVRLLEWAISERGK